MNYRSSRSLLLAVVTLGLALVGARGALNPPVLAFPVERYALPNGLQVVLHADHKLPLVYVSEWVHAGGRDDPSGRAGLAHLCEHMMFEGSKNAPEYFKAIAKTGASETSINANTYYDRTCYFAGVPTENLEYLLWLESDRLATMADAVTQEKLDRVRGVVRNERMQRVDDVPYGLDHTLLMEELFPAGHPYHTSCIGSEESLNAISVQDVKTFFRQHYGANTTTLLLAGDFDPADARKWIEKYYGPIAPIAAGPRLREWVPASMGTKVLEVHGTEPRERTEFAWSIPPPMTQEHAALELASYILGSNARGRLTSELAGLTGLCSSVTTGTDPYLELAGVLEIEATARPQQSLAKIEEVITDQIESLAEDGPTAEELHNAKGRWQSRTLAGVERMLGPGGRLDRMSQYAVFQGDPGLLKEEIALYRGITAEQVQVAVAKWLEGRGHLTLRYRPAKQPAVPTTTVDRTVVPALYAPRPVRLPEVKSARLPNGLQILVIERHDRPSVAIRLVCRAGSMADAAGKDGVAFLTAAYLSWGGRVNLFAEDLEKSINGGIELRPDAGLDSSQLSTTVDKARLGDALKTLGENAAEPNFVAWPLDLIRRRLSEAYTEIYADPRGLTAEIGCSLLYGAQHPYGRMPYGTKDSVGHITLEDMRTFWRSYWRPGNSALILAGDVTLEEAVRVTRRTLGEWSGVAKPLPSVVKPPMPTGRRIYLVDRPGAAQTYISLLLPLPGSAAGDDHGVYAILDQIWSGSMQSRLNDDLRVKSSVTYGGASEMRIYPEAGSWWTVVPVQTDRTAEALGKTLNEVEALGGDRPVTTEELGLARSALLRTMVQVLETPVGEAALAEMAWLEKRQPSAMQQELDNLVALTPDDVNTAARGCALPGRATVLLIGDMAKIERDVRAMNLGEVIVLDQFGKPRQPAKPATQPETLSQK